MWLYFPCIVGGSLLYVTFEWFSSAYRFHVAMFSEHIGLVVRMSVSGYRG